jgi:hypothetical protein
MGETDVPECSIEGCSNPGVHPFTMEGYCECNEHFYESDENGLRTRIAYLEGVVEQQDKRIGRLESRLNSR